MFFRNEATLHVDSKLTTSLKAYVCKVFPGITPPSLLIDISIYHRGMIVTFNRDWWFITIFLASFVLQMIKKVVKLHPLISRDFCRTYYDAYLKECIYCFSWKLISIWRSASIVHLCQKTMCCFLFHAPNISCPIHRHPWIA